MPLSDSELGELDTLMRRSVANGIREVVQDPEVLEAFWGGAATVLQRTARERTGGFVLGALGGLLSRVWLFVLLGGIVYALGGWSALGKLWASLSPPTGS
jgi:hypothetical protein